MMTHRISLVQRYVFGWRGAVRATYQTARCLLDLGYGVDLVGTESPLEASPYYTLPKGAQVHRFARTQLGNSLESWQDYGRELLHRCMPNKPIIASNIIDITGLHLARRSVVAYIQADELAGLEVAPEFLHAAIEALKTADKVISVSPYISDRLTAHGIRSSCVIAPAVGEAFRRPSNTRRYGYSVLYVGSTEAGKNFELMNPVMNALEQAVDSCTSVVCSRDSEARMPLTPPNCRISKPSRDLDVRNEYWMAGVVLHLSTREGFGLVPIEAMACGTPVVAIADGGPRSYLAPDKNCAAPSLIAEDIACAAARVLCDKEYRDSIIENGLLTAKEYSLDRMREGWEGVLEDIG